MPKNPTAKLLTEIYERLVKRNGLRNWWPVKHNAGDNAGFEITAGAILVQNTSWRNASRALENLNSAGIWGYGAIHECAVDDLVEAILCSGYYNTKSKKLKAFAQVVVEDFNGNDSELFALSIPELRERLLGIYGIGEETSDDIILYAAKKPSFVVDAYTRRVVDRIGIKVDGNRYSDYQEIFEANLEPDVELWGELHAQLDGHAARVCTKRDPRCGECVLVDLCDTGASRHLG